MAPTCSPPPLSITAYLVGYQRPAHHPEFLAGHPGILKLAHYLVLWVGSYFNSSLANPFLVGLAAIALLVVALSAPSGAFENTEPGVHFIPGLLIALYVCVTAGITALGRIGFGVEQALDIPLPHLQLVLLSRDRRPAFRALLFSVQRSVHDSPPPFPSRLLRRRARCSYRLARLLSRRSPPAGSHRPTKSASHARARVDRSHSRQSKTARTLSPSRNACPAHPSPARLRNPAPPLRPRTTGGSRAKRTAPAQRPTLRPARNLPDRLRPQPPRRRPRRTSRSQTTARLHRHRRRRLPAAITNRSPSSKPNAPAAAAKQKLPEKRVSFSDGTINPANLPAGDVKIAAWAVDLQSEKLYPLAGVTFIPAQER